MKALFLRFNRPVRLLVLMQDLAEESGQFEPGTSRQELNHPLNLPQ